MRNMKILFWTLIFSTLIVACSATKSSRNDKPASNIALSKLDSLPDFCGNLGLFYGELKFHKTLKDYYIHQSRLNYDFKIEGVISPKYLGETVVILGDRQAAYPPGGTQEGPFQSIIKKAKLLQVAINNQINLKQIRQNCP